MFKHQILKKMKKQVFIFQLCLVALLFSSGIVAQTKWNVDRTHSNVKFSVAHMVVSEVEGNLRCLKEVWLHQKTIFLML